MTVRRWPLFVVVALLMVGCGSQVDLDSSRGQLRFGVQAARMDLWREAMFRFERALQLEPNNVMALNNLAVAYEGIGEFEKARETYVRALQIDRSNQYIQRNYSRFMEYYSSRVKEENSEGESPDAPKDGDHEGGRR